MHGNGLIHYIFIEKEKEKEKEKKKIVSKL